MQVSKATNEMSDQLQAQPFWEERGLPAPGAEMTPAAFDALPETMLRVEYIDGRVVYPNWNEDTMSPTPVPMHQRTVGYLHLLLQDIVPGGEVVLSPMDVKFGERKLQPDVFWIAEEGACVAGENHFIGAPDLVVEVLSSGNASHDRITKHAIYEAHGVREYWIVDPAEQLVEVFSLEDSVFLRVGLFEPGDTFTSPLLDNVVNVQRVFSA